ncbi:putative FMN/FAD exporter YeeO [Vibrio stylophorae]|uniref:Multidrug resistance protein NorM n=1 Tax=Vibrio stylophorae TaxID=659351 RepID=A0ABN8DUB0_9VIBR|nr:MATE family efflux transporter [Vibrio stylophorae]CAH0533505.1 putative FMN/FAD exporter YeeO [Vibrio stylophorae]
MHAWIQAADRSFWQKTWQLAIPVSLQCLMFSVLGLVDIFMVTELGESAVAAVGIGNRIIFFNLLLVVGIASAVGVLASQYFGAQRMDGVRRVLLQSWLLAILFTLPFILIYCFYPREVMAIVNDTPEYLTLGQSYLLITGVSLVTTALVVPLEGALRAIGQARMPTWVSLIAVILNAILNALLIFGLFGFPEMGVTGAAIGTLLSRIAQTILLFAISWRRYRFLFPDIEAIRALYEKRHWHKYIGIALPMVFHDAGWAIGVLVYNVIVGQMGMSELAIMSLLSPIEGLLISAFIGFSVAASTMLGHELGVKNYLRAWQIAWWLIVVSVVLAIVTTFLVYLCLPWIGEAFALSSIQDAPLAVSVTLVLALGLPLKVFNMVGISGVLRSGGDIRWMIIIDLMAQWLVGIPLACVAVFVFHWALPAVLLIILCEELVKIGLTQYRIRSRKWLNNLIDEPEGMTISMAS